MIPVFPSALWKLLVWLWSCIWAELSGGLAAAGKEVKASNQPVKASKVGLVWNKNFAKHLVGKRDQTTANNIKGTGPRPRSGA